MEYVSWEMIHNITIFMFQHVICKPFEILDQYLIIYCYTAFYKTSNFEFAKTMPRFNAELVTSIPALMLVFSLRLHSAFFRCCADRMDFILIRTI